MTKKESDSKHINTLKVVTVAAVLALHAGVTVALVKMDVPQHIKPPEESKPIEIELVQPLIEEEEPPQPEPIVEPVSEVKPEPPKAASEPKKTEPKKAEPKKAEPKKTEPKKTEPKKTEPKKTEPKKTEPKKTEPKKAEPKKAEPKKTEPKKTEPVISSEELNKRLKWEAEQERLRQQQADREAKERAEREAKERAEREAKERAEREAKERAEREAKERAEREAIAAANQPQQLSASKASWRKKPNLVTPPSIRRNSRPGDVFKVSLRLDVDKQGNVIDAEVVSGSGNKVIDRDAKRSAKSAKFHPFKNNNGQPISGYVVISLEYEIS